jgi:dipeptidyl aminopeptidase/acylaminoacyl peptidase
MAVLRRRIVCSLALLVVVVGTYALPSAQSATKKKLTIDDYTKWKTIADPAISPDGKWVVYTLQLTNTTQPEAKPVLHLKNLETNEEVTVQHASGGTFSPDSAWLAYQVDPGAAQRARAARSGGSGSGGSGSAPSQPTTPSQPPTPPAPLTPPSTPPGVPPPPATPPGTPPSTPPTPPPTTPQTPPTQPQPSGPPQTPSTQPEGQGQRGRGGNEATPPRRVEVRNLATGEVRSWQDIGTFGFSPSSSHLYMRRRAPEGQGGATGGRGAGGGAPGGGQGGGREGGANAQSGPRGLDVILLDLKSGRHQLLGSVADIAFNRTGTLLGYTVDAAVKDANGVFVFDARSGRIAALDNDAKNYNRLTWNEEGFGLAVLKGLDVDKMREKDNVLLAFPDVREAFDDEGNGAVTPAILEPAKADGFPKGWVVSDRSTLVWSEDNTRVFFGIKEQKAAPDSTRRNTDETPDVDVWNTGDERIQSAQMVRAEQERNFTFRQAFDVANRKFIRLTDDTMRDIDLAPDGRWGVGRDLRGYIHDFKRPAADFYRVDTSTGQRTLMLKGQLTAGHTFGITPHGKHFIYWKDNRYHAYDLDRGASTPLGNGNGVGLIDAEYDHPGPRPPYGLNGYASDGNAILAQGRYDIWLLPLDGSAPRNLTAGYGTKNEVRLRYVRIEPVDLMIPRAVGPRNTVDLSKPLVLSAYGEYTKKAGYFELVNGQLKELVFEDAAFSTPVKAAKADRYLLRRETFTEYPNLRITGPDFKDSRVISDANPQHKEYTWGKRVLFDYKNKDGVRLQGIIALPDDYKPGERRPMIVTFYEKSSQGMHRYSNPSFLTGMGSSPVEALSRGYIIMQPDVHFRTGSSHSDMLECVEAATRKVIELGYADPKRIGVNGHSYGGEGAAFIGVMSKMFAAVGMGAGVTDLYNDFSQNWGWAYQYSGGSGANGNDYYLYGQGRWGFSPWDDPERYRFESALTHAPKASAPFLIMHGTADPTVHFNNALGFYNALRYNGKKAVLLAYPNEGHGLRGIANRRDLTIRFFEFFDHYLKDAPAPKWLSDGVPYLAKTDATTTNTTR